MRNHKFFYCPICGLFLGSGKGDGKAYKVINILENLFDEELLRLELPDASQPEEPQVPVCCAYVSPGTLHIPMEMRDRLSRLPLSVLNHSREVACETDIEITLKSVVKFWKR